MSEQAVRDPLEYVLKNSYGKYWNGKRWDLCLRCATRLSRDEAHKQAHKDSSEGWSIKRVRPKKKTPRRSPTRPRGTSS